MAIADGQKIAIRFTQPLVGNVLGLDPPIGYATKKIDLSGAAVSVYSTYSLSYPPSNAIDGNTTTYWWANGWSNWFQIQLKSERVVTKLRLYLGSYYIKTFTFSGSNDGNEWIQIGGEYTAANTTSAKWYEFDIDNSNSYLYYRIETLATYTTSYFYLYELELYETVPSGNETKFTVSFDEYDMVPGGSVSKVTRPVVGIEHFFTLNDDVDLSNGSFENTEYSGSGICLSKKEAE